MAKIRALLAIWILTCGLLLGGTAVSAQETIQAQLSAGAPAVRNGEKVELVLSLSDLESLTAGLYSIQGTLDYHPALFQDLSPEDFTPLNGWENPEYNPENRQFVLIRRSGDAAGGPVLKITLTAKEELTPGQTQVSIRELSASEGKEDLFPLDAQAALSAVVQVDSWEPAADSPQLPTIPAGEGQPHADPEGVLPEQQPEQETASSEQDKESSVHQHPTEQPREDGLSGTAVFLLCAGGAAAIAAVGLVLLKKKKGSGRGKKLLSALIVLTAAATLTAGGVYAFGGKGDLNGDGKVDYADVHLLQKHLIGWTVLPHEKQNGADLNYNGRLTVTDLALLIQAVEQKLDYQVSLIPALDQVYYEKQQEIQLKFSAWVSHGEKLQRVTINQTQYPVEPMEEGAYLVRLQAADTPGVQTLRFTQATLSGGQQVALDVTETIGVLKSAPEITDFLAEEETDTARMKVSFTLADEDAALTAAKLELRKEEDGALLSVSSQEVSAGFQELWLDLEENIPYTLSITAQYRRDSDQLPTAEDHRGSWSVMKQLQLNLDYRFTFGGLQTQTQDGRPTAVFAKGQPIALWFESGNATQFQPERVIVNGNSYPVQPSGAGYLALLEGQTQAGVQQLTVEQVILENGKAFSLDGENQVSITVQKELPTAALLSMTEDPAGEQIQLSIQLSDPDDALSNHRIRITNAQQQVVGERDLSPQDWQEGLFQGQVTLTDTGLTTSYLVEFLADRDLSPDQSQPEGQQVLAGQEIAAQPRVLLQSGSAGAEVVEKGGQVELTYTLSHNLQAELAGMVVNHLQLTPRQQPDGSWKVTVPAPSQAGPQSFALSQLVFADGTLLETHHELWVEVKKSAPVVQEYQTIDRLETQEVQFQFRLEDGDNAFLSGKVQLLLDGAVAEEQSIVQPGEQSFTFAVQEQTHYTFQVLSTWTQTQDGSQQQEEILLEKAVYLIRDYGLQLSQLQTFSPQGSETPYFEPNSPITLRFTAETRTSLQAQQVQINGRVFSLTPLGANRYELTAKLGASPGVQTFKLEKLMLENGKELAVTDVSIQAEILKAVPAVEQFSWEKTPQDQLKIEFVLQDPDGALESGRVEISQKDGTVFTQQPLTSGKNQGLAQLAAGEEYLVQIIGDYDRDSNALDSGSNRYEQQLLYATGLTVTRDGIQFKDVTRTRLFYSDSAGSREIPVLDITQGLPQETAPYYAVLEMEGLPDFYGQIREFRQDPATGKVYGVLQQDEVLFYDGEGNRQEEYVFALPYRDEQGEHPLVESAQQLFSQMSAAPNGDYVLTQDLDASGLSPDAAAVAGTFTGTLNGNGYRILNLPTSLFQTVSGATIQNLVIENAQITTSRSGILANVIQNGAVVREVFLVDCVLQNNVDELGAFAGNLKNATIERSASVNVSVKGLVAVGGIVGKTNAGAVIDNCYVTGKIQGSYDHPSLGARVGGIAGWHGGGVIQNSFTQVQVIAPAQKGNGGLIGGPNTGSPVLENCLSMSSGAGYRIAGFDVLANAKNVYEYAGSSSLSNITQANREQIRETDAVFDKDFYTQSLGWEEGIWELDLLAYGKRPNLHAAPETDNNYGIPAYASVLSQKEYRPQREQAYANLAKLLPFSDVRTWVESANRLPEDHPLAVQAVEFVLPLDQNGNLVNGVHQNNLENIQAIRVVFAQEKPQEYPVSLKKTMGEVVAVYQIQGLDLNYQPRFYVGNLSDTLLDQAADPILAWNYTADLATLTGEEESRLYKDYYQQTVQPKLRGVVENLLLSQQEYPTYCPSPAVQQLVQQRIAQDEIWKKLLYGYNYYDKWYRMDYRGVSLSDLLYFHGSWIHPDLTAQGLSEQLLGATEQQRETHQTVTFYNQVLKRYTEEALTDFLGGLSYRLAGYDTPSDWFAQNFEGILKEQAPQGGADGIRYRIWDILSGLEDSKKSILLPILTAPQEDMYLISMPSQLMIGSLNRYPTYLVKDGLERQRMEEIIEVYAQKMGVFYGVSSTWMENSVEVLNSFVNIQYDTRLNFPQSEAADAGDQDKDKTRDPVMKWVYEANNTISAKNSSAAFANGSVVYWVLEAALGTSDYIFFTFSHETAHNQDGRYFYGGAGRRNGTGAEAHADGNIAQEMRDGCMVFNISKINDMGLEMTGNFSYERIDSPEKIHSYYSQMFETGYVLDYLAAKAFLQLTPQQQAAIAVQATHTPEGNASFTTLYHDVTVEGIQQMDLRDPEDLWENRISIRNLKKGSSEKINTATDGSYGFESFYNMNWYQSHNDNGSPDTHAFKRLGMEMLGVGGYERGYQIYMSARSQTDLDALRQITGKEDITWKDYKLGRFQAVEEKLDQIPYFDAETVIRQFREAMEQDVQNGTRSETIQVKRMLYGLVKRVTGDFSQGGIYESPQVISVTSAQQLMTLAAENPYGYYRLEEDLDFTGVAATQGSYLPQRFMGILDGNGHRIAGLQLPLFGDLQYAQITDLTLAQPSYQAGAQAALAVKSRQVILGNVVVEGKDSQLPLIKTKSEGYYQYTQ